MSYAAPLNGMMGAVARELLGTPSHEREGLLRFGSHGSIEVNTKEGWFADYEADVRGGVFKLIEHKAGITDHAAAFRWLEAHGIKEPSNDTDGRGFYDYTDESSAVLFRVERRGKGFMPPFLQHAPDGNGGFHAAKGCMQGVRRVLYRLHRLVAANASEIVFVCEGEKDADRLELAGLIATTNPGGAGKFRAEFARFLAGRRVVVLEDNDEPGRKHAKDVKAKLEGVAATVAILALDGLPNKGDVSDWLDADGTVAELVERANAALARPAEPLAHPSSPIDPAAMLGEVHTFYRRFVSFPSPHAAVACTLWAAHAHAMDMGQHASPRLPVAGAGQRQKQGAGGAGPSGAASGGGGECLARLPVPQGRRSLRAPDDPA